MIPTEEQCKQLWNTYQLPQAKRVHVVCVARVALWLAKQVKSKTSQKVNDSLLLAGALLHDIDKAVEKLLGEHHPDAGVRILKAEGMAEVAALVKIHPLHSILDHSIAPKTWEEKLLYLADKMCKYEIITVDKRFALWNEEHLPADQQDILDRSYPLVKNLEAEIFNLIGLDPEIVAKRV